MENATKEMLLKVRKNGSFPSTASGKKITEALTAIGWTVEKTIFGEETRKMPIASPNDVTANNNHAYNTAEYEWIDGEREVITPYNINSLIAFRNTLIEMPKIENAKKLKAGDVYVTDISEITPYSDEEFHKGMGEFNYKVLVVTRGHKVTAKNGNSIEISKLNGYNLSTFFRDNSLKTDVCEALGMVSYEEERKAATVRTDDNIGTCGCCGGTFKLNKDGRMVNHGFTRPGYGYNEGKCMGEKLLPYEKSAEGAVAGRENEINAKAFFENKLISLEHKTELPHTTGWGNNKKTEMITEESVHWKGVYSNFKRMYENAIKHAESNIEWLEKRIENWEPRLLPDEIKAAAKA